MEASERGWLQRMRTTARTRVRTTDAPSTATQTRGVCIMRRSNSWLSLSGDVVKFPLAVALVTLASRSMVPVLPI